MSTLHIVPHIENQQLTYMELKKDLESDKFDLLVTESDQPGTVLVEAGSNFIFQEFLLDHQRHAVERTFDDKLIFDADYYLNTIIPECATYLGCETIKLPQ